MKENRNLREEILEFFLEQAPIMGEIALRYFRNLTDDDVKEKQGYFHDPVTIADLEIRDYLVPLIKKTYKEQVALLTEESAKTFEYSQQELLRTGKPLLIVDELDGTKNFKDGKEDFSILFGLAERAVDGYRMTVGLVYRPLTSEFYFATIDSDAKHKDREGIERDLFVSGRDKIVIGGSPVNVAVGRETFPLDYPNKYHEVIEAMERFRETHLQQVRCNSRFSCGLEIMDVAGGKVDVFLCAKGANWDFAGPSLILRQAGGEAYLAKSVDMLTFHHPWRLQLSEPEKYYPAFFTNKVINEGFFKHMERYTE